MKINPNSDAQKNTLSWIYLAGFFFILFLSLVNLPPWFSPPDWGKVIIFRIIASFLIFVFLSLLLFHQLARSSFSIIKAIKRQAIF